MATTPDRYDDPRARFEAIYDEHVTPIHRFIYARVGNRPDAEDLTGLVFMRAVEQLDVDRPAPQISAWLYRVAQNAIADYWRAFYRLPAVGVDHVAPGWEPADDGAQRAAPPNESATIFPMPMRFLRGSADRAWSSVAPVLLNPVRLLIPALPSLRSFGCRSMRLM